jgi:hypothetical protein
LPGPLVVQTGNLGIYNFDDLPSGQSYTISVTARRFTFTPSSHVIFLTGDTTNSDFVADPGFGVRQQ